MCSHIEAYKKKNRGLETYELVHGFFVACLAKGSSKTKSEECFCNAESCKTEFKRIHACLSCAFFGCYETHIRQHCKERKHFLAIDTSSGNVYCFECQDYIYDSELEEIANRHRIIVACRRPDVSSYTYMPTLKDVKRLQMFRPPKLVINGLRGITNMGQTCYMSCILQSLAHAPVIRDYFLSDEHKCSFQEETEETLLKSDDLSVCFSCEMGKTVQELYSGEEDSYVPHRLLYLMWQQKKSLASYGQHDAHEFLIEFLNVLHAHCKVTNGPAEHHPNCIMDKIFTGFSQSELTCLECQSVTTTVESFNIISLNLDSHSNMLPPTIAGKKVVPPMPTLIDCLERLTQAEDLSCTCDNCKSGENCKMQKQMKLRKLPLILIFHLERLSSSYNNRPIEFQEHLDMTPYISNYKASGDATSPENKCHRGFDKTLSNKFYLFAVVQHKGNASSGHYLSHVRFQKNEWYICDDHKISETEFEKVKKVPAYLLFYHKEFLEYDEEKLISEKIS